MTAKLQTLARDTTAGGAQAPLDTVMEALSRLRYGSIQLTVHDGRLVQVEVTERRRYT